MNGESASSSGTISRVAMNTIAGYIGLIPTFSGTDETLTAEIFFQTVEQIAEVAIGTKRKN